MNLCYNLHIKPSQFHALLPRILAGRAQTYYIQHINWTTTFRKAYDTIKRHFDTEVNHVHYYTDWTTNSAPLRNCRVGTALVPYIPQPSRSASSDVNINILLAWITNSKIPDESGVVGLQTDDTMEFHHGIASLLLIAITLMSRTRLPSVR